ncbi:MAG: DNA repair protein RadC [Acholeplasmatales bacterium]|nr:DNA repair protein RadC [Acholeplasmatales bacterium]
MKIKEMKNYLKPTEKLKTRGVKNLSDSELLAILIKSGTKNLNAIEIADSILNDLNNLSDILNLDYFSLLNYEGIGEAKAIQIISSIELFKRATVSYNSGELVDTKDKVFNMLRPRVSTLNYEKVFVLFLNIKCKLIRLEEYSDGDVNHVNFPIRKIVEKALLLKSPLVIVSHNHPSNDTTPSESDIEATIHLEEALNTIDVCLLDHVIVGKDNYYSMKENLVY